MSMESITISIDRQTKKKKEKNREVWVDNVKVIACILVVLGHFFQSMTKANILPANNLYRWFNQTIYYFHVPLFFICSGYLYQEYLRVFDIVSWKKSVLKKLIALGIPYFTFSIVTLELKTLFGGVVNSSGGNVIETLFFNPTSPYWYLYVLFFIFLITPNVKSSRQLSKIIATALAVKIILLSGVMGNVNLPYALNGIMNNEIWFASGMSLSAVGVSKAIKKNDWMKASFIGITFIILSIVVYELDILFKGMDFLLGIMACVTVVLLMIALFKDRPQNKVFEFLATYTLPIFVMHTIFAAGLRAILMKIGINNVITHVVIGIGISFVGPILTAMIMKKSRVLEFFLYPSKFIKV